VLVTHTKMCLVLVWGTGSPSPWRFSARDWTDRRDA